MAGGNGGSGQNGAGGLGGIDFGSPNADGSAGTPSALGSGGGGGGGAGVTGGTGGAGGSASGGTITNTMGNGGQTSGGSTRDGGNGVNGTNPGDGGGGGGGGGLGTPLNTTDNRALAATIGGDGGRGGNGVGSGGGGGGGAGGYGNAVLDTTITGQTIYLNDGTIGGHGGAGGGGYNGGAGGSGGVGLIVAGANNTIYTGNDLRGGDGGTGGTANGGTNGAAGAGGAGFVATGGGTTLYVGHINGGLSGDGVTRADAITLSGGANKVYLGGFGITGSIRPGSGSNELYSGIGSIVDGGIAGDNTQFNSGDSLTIYNGLTAGGDSTYSGTIFINSGTFQSGNGGVTGRISSFAKFVLAASDSTLAINSSSAVTLGNSASASTLSGAGGVTQLGTGVTTLLGSNTYSGATTINAGTLQLGDGTTNGTVSTASAINIASGATLAFKEASAVAVGNTITGSGSLAQTGPGTITLLGANTYSGGTTISAGTLQIGNGGTTGSVTGDIANNAAFIFNRSNNLSFGGVISGTGTLQKLGAGVLTLTNVDTYTGATTVSGGTLLVNGSISASATTVQNGGTLGGSGTAGAVTVASGGTLSPGNSPGLLNTGNLALANGATYVEEIGGTTVGTQYDQTNVTGTVNLNSGNAASGATLSVRPVNGFTPSAGQSYVIINNDGNDAVVGTFVGLAEGATVMVNGVALTISYRGGDGNDVTLSAPVPFNPPSGPTAVNDTASGTFGRMLTATAPGVLANDSGSGGALTVTAVNGQTANVGKAVLGTYGSLTLNGDGSYTYTPDATKTVFTTSAVDHFTYTDTANGQTATASLDITVSAPPASTLALFGTAVTNSASQTGSVYALYEGLLGRAPDALGLEGFSASLQAGAKLTDVAAAILNSAERGGLVSDPNAYVQALYTNTLHRAPDSAGQQFYVNELNSGVSQATVAVQFASSTEAAQVNAPAFSTGVFVTDAIDAAVARLYYGLLGRTPDAGGLGSFEMQVKQAAAAGGVNGAIQGLASVANAMLGSQEYGATHAGQSNAAFVDSVYVGALGRHADAGGSAFFTNELAQGVSQAQVALQIAQSQEAQVHLVGQIELGWHLA